MCRYDLPDAIVSDNGTKLASAVVTDFCKDLGVQTKFVYVVDTQASKQAEYANKVILKGLKKKLGDAKGLWAKLLHEILWSYDTTPQSTTMETPFSIVYGPDLIRPVEIETS